MKASVKEDLISTKHPSSGWLRTTSESEAWETILGKSFLTDWEMNTLKLSRAKVKTVRSMPNSYISFGTWLSDSVASWILTSSLLFKTQKAKTLSWFWLCTPSSHFYSGGSMKLADFSKFKLLITWGRMQSLSLRLLTIINKKEMIES